MLKRLLASFGIILLLAAFAPPEQTDLITLSASAGFDGSFREDQWMPVYVRVSNTGEGIDGRLVVRPETSNGAVNSAFSVPISLPSGSQKAVFLYIIAQSFANEIRVELIDQSGTVVAAQPVSVRSVLPRDQLHVVVTQSASGILDMTSVHDGGYNAFQANWSVADIPDRSAALSAVNSMIFNDIDTSTLSTGQTQAITDWVAQGGHLLVMGGPSWQTTAAGLKDLLPLVPNASTSLDSLAPLSDWLRSTDSPLSGQAIIATGTLSSDARVMVKTEDDVPLLARRSLGTGTIDYLTADPNTQPLRGWGGLPSLWLTLASTVNVQPPWIHGFTDWQTANDAVNILPGVDLLPDILPLCGFLAIYIALIGPLNYLVLNRLNRRELAWITIPLFIIVFSALAWAVGFNLRGNEVTLSRLSLIESWPDVQHARVQELIGLLSPRRAQYSMALSDSSFLHPVPLTNQSGSLFGSNLQVSTDIQQTDIFRAADFPVDASFIAPFQATTSIDKPQIDGQATLFYDDSGMQVMRGSVTNSSDQTLQDPVILVRGQAQLLDKPLAPGDTATFELMLPGEGDPSPSPLAFDATSFTSVYFRSYSYQNNIPQTVKDILGQQLDDRRYSFAPSITATTAEQERYRRQLFLTSFIQDSYNVMTGRGDHAYLVGWTNNSPLGVTLEGGTWRSLDTSLYLVQLAVEFTPPTDEALISSDQFTWMVQNRSMFNDIAPVNLSFQSGEEVAFRFTPLPDAVLSSVNELLVYVDRTSQSSTRTIPLYLWNWEISDWEPMQITSGNRLVVRSPERFLGPENAVQVRIVADEIGGYPRFNDLSVEQRGEF